jgi:hypothetical protein
MPCRNDHQNARIVEVGGVRTRAVTVFQVVEEALAVALCRFAILVVNTTARIRVRSRAACAVSGRQTTGVNGKSDTTKSDVEVDG